MKKIIILDKNKFLFNDAETVLSLFINTPTDAVVLFAPFDAGDKSMIKVFYIDE